MNIHVHKYVKLECMTSIRKSIVASLPLLSITQKRDPSKFILNAVCNVPLNPSKS